MSDCLEEFFAGESTVSAAQFGATEFMAMETVLFRVDVVVVAMDSEVKANGWQRFAESARGQIRDTEVEQARERFAGDMYLSLDEFRQSHGIE